MDLKKADYFEGRKLRKKLDAESRKAARTLLDQDGDEAPQALRDARAIMETYHWMKTSHLDSVILKKPPFGGWLVLLTFKDLPRGMPNVLGAPQRPTTEEGAREEALRLLTAAHVKCADPRRMMRDGQMDDLRLFRYQSLNLQVPGEMVDGAAKKYLELPEGRDLKKQRQAQIDKMKRIIGAGPLTVERWNALGEKSQAEVMVAASHLLCLNINSVG